MKSIKVILYDGTEIVSQDDHIHFVGNASQTFVFKNQIGVELNISTYKLKRIEIIETPSQINTQS